MGESGKLVQRLFDNVKEKLADPATFVIVLIDEVESLTSARKNASSALECSDSLRMVISLLTQLDAIKRFPNVLVLATSNLTGSIDRAFLDRADLKKYIGLPPPAAILKMLESSIQELEMKGVISGLLDTSSPVLEELAEIMHANHFSGRTIRKVAFLGLCRTGKKGRDKDTFLIALRNSVEKLAKDQEQLSLSDNTA